MKGVHSLLGCHMNNKSSILLVEDDINLGTILKEYLEVKNYLVTLALNGVDGYKEYSEGSFDICILDVMMPKKDGFTLAKEIRNYDDRTPIIFLTAKSLQHDKIEGFKIGADDYITKPFNTEELLMRINAVLKRTSSKKKKSDKIIFNIGQYEFNSEKRILLFNDSEYKLTSKENELLKLLAINKNEILKRSEALVRIWSDDNYFNSRSMDVYITKLRGYLKQDKSVEIINVHGQGFKLIV
jgi:DNA-binding response OmpR family regulator